MTYSQMAYAVIDYIQEKGFKVINFSDDLPKNVAGQIRYDKKEIHINVGDAETGLYTLLHEAGHLLSYLRLYVQQNKPQPSPESRELYALVYGWKVIKDLQLPITKEMWKANCH